MSFKERLVSIARFVAGPEGIAVCALVVLGAAGSFLPAIGSRPASVLFLAVAAATVVVAVRGLRPAAVRMADQDRELPREAWLLAGIAAVAALLRLPFLGTNPPGLVVDEAYQILQGIAAWSGETIPERNQYPYPTWPVWWAMTASFTRLFGATVAAARLPSALIGILTVVIAWRVARDLFGRAAGVAAALFVCGSFWHVHHSRLALEWNALVAEGLLVAWLLLAPRFEGRWWASALAGAVCGVSCYGYTAALYLPLWGLVVVGLKIAAAGGDGRRDAARRGAVFVAGAAIVVAIGLNTIVLRSGVRVDQYFRLEASVEGRNELLPPANLLTRATGSGGQWTNFPLESARLSPVERTAVLFGLVLLVVLPGIPRVVRLAIGAWLPLAILPEMVPGEIHLARGIGAVAPLAMLAGLAGRLAASANVRALAAASLVAGAANAAGTAYRLYAEFPHDKHVRNWYSAVSVDASRFVSRISHEGFIEMFPELTYVESPIMRTLLWNDIREKRIVPLANAPDEVRPLRTFRHLLTGDPMLIFLATPRFPEERRTVLISMIGLLETGRDLERAGDFAGAAEFYRRMLERFPGSKYTRARLDQVLERITVTPGRL